MKAILFISILALALSGCALFKSVFAAAGDDDKQSLGRDLGGAMQMVVEGEWIAGGIATLMAVLAGTGRYFFRRGEKAEKKKGTEITDAVERSRNGDPVSTEPGPAIQPG